MKLFTKYNRINLTVMVFLFILTGIINYVQVSKALSKEVDEALGEYEERVEKYVSQNDSLPVFKNFEEVEVDYHLTDKVLGKSYSRVERYDPEEHKMGTYRQLIFTQVVHGKLYEINIAKPLEGTKTLTKSIVYSTLAILLIIITISSLVNHLVLRKLWQPFYATINEMRGFKLGNKVEPLLPNSDIEEFSFMNRSLSEVIHSAKDDYRILKEFTENASHETQTPLAIIRSKLDLVIQEEGLSVNQSEALKSVYAGIHRLSKLNMSLLLLAKIENQQFANTENIDMQEKLKEKLWQFHELWEGNKLNVVENTEPASLIANPELIDVLLNNLLSNAVRHSADGGEIQVILKPGMLRISNTSTGNELDAKKLFSRFYKEAQHSQNNGLGLSIVKQICDHSGIDIKYDFLDQWHSFTFNWRV